MSPHTTGIVQSLIDMYRKEDPKMATTLEEINRKIKKEALEEATVDELLKKLTIDDRLKGLPVEDRLKGLPAEERLRGLSAEEIEAYLRVIRKDNPQGK